MAVQISRRLFSIDEYRRMGEAGIFSEDDRVELIEGEIVVMSPIGVRHVVGVRRLGDLFSRSLISEVILDVQNPLGLDLDSEPQPDLTLLRRQQDYYASKPPTCEDILLVVEVADTSVGYDRSVKGPIYARCGIREYWLVDIPGDALEVYRQPTHEGYRYVRRLRRGETISLEAFPEVTFSVDAILG